MAAPAFFALTKSDLNAFLHAPVGEERDGMILSVFSGFARLELDPWAEAERLAGLPAAKAIETLAHAIARMSASWLPPEARRIAERLIPLLPHAGAGARPGDTPQRHAPAWLFWLLLAALAIAAIMYFVQ